MYGLFQDAFVKKEVDYILMNLDSDIEVEALGGLKPNMQRKNSMSLVFLSLRVFFCHLAATGSLVFSFDSISIPFRFHH
jgi:hypothetical protein